MGDADKNKGMNEVQRLYPEVIYRFNSQFRKAWKSLRKDRKNDEFKDGGAIALPVFFSKSSRTFHWIGVDRSMWSWDDDQCAGSLQKLIQFLRDWNSDEELTGEQFGCAGQPHSSPDRQKAWDDFLEDQPEGCKEAIETIKQAIKSQSTPLNWEPIHRAILALYSGFHQNAEEHIEGVFYQFLKECGNHGVEGRFEYLEGKLDGHTPSRLLELKEPCKELGSGCGKECIKFKSKFDVLGTSKHLNSHISLKFLEYLLLREESSDTNSLSKKLADKRHIALLPLYDIWIGDRGYGGIKAVFIIYFASEPFREDWINKKYPKLRSAFPELAEEVRESAETLAASLPITPPYDLVRHFLKVLICVQDWESATVFKTVFENGRSQYKFQYEYKRKLQEGSEFKWDWEIKEATDIPMDQEPSKPELAPSRDKPIQEGSSSKKYMWWTVGEDGTIKLWSQEFIPGLSDEEVNRFGNLSIRFEFPKATHIPSNDKDRKRLHQEYLRQQLDLMRMLIPKVRARRSALRNAAVSIMARNMSHNIGSHVLAALQRDTKHGEHEISTLFSHLQSRMDFIAELSTSAASVHMATSIKDDIVGKEPGKDNGIGFMGQKLLSTYISARRNNRNNNSPVQGKVEFKEGASLFSCAGGLLGQQALFVIFENLIRNIAKHNSDLTDPGFIKLKLRCEPDGDFLDYIKLFLWDEQGNACNKKKNDKESKGNKSDTGHKCSVEASEDCSSSSLGMVWRDLDDEYRNMEILSANGMPKDSHWGLKEILICAAYLRGVALEDMESHLPDNGPPFVQILPVDDDGKSTFCDGAQGQASEKRNISYCIRLPIVKELAVIVDELPEQKIFNQAKKEGVGFFTKEEIINMPCGVPHRLTLWALKEPPSPKQMGKISPRIVCNGSGFSLGKIDELKESAEKKCQEPDECKLVSVGFNNGMFPVQVQDILEVTVSHDCLKGEISTNEIDQEFKNCVEKLLLADYHRNIFGLTYKIFPNKPYPYNCIKGRFLDFLKWGGGYEVFPGVSSQVNLLRSWKPEGTLQNEWARGLWRGVLILDERIQERVWDPKASHPYLSSGIAEFALEIVNKLNEYYPEDGWKKYFSFPSLLAAANIWVPSSKDVDLYNPAQGDSNLDSFMGALTLGNIEAPSGRKLSPDRIKYVVIHQGVIDRLCRDNVDLTPFFTYCKDKILVVCSGRGRPGELKWIHDRRPDVRFIAVSAILEHVVNRPSKVHLVLTLDSSRCPL